MIKREKASEHSNNSSSVVLIPRITHNWRECNGIWGDVNMTWWHKQQSPSWNDADWISRGVPCLTLASFPIMIPGLWSSICSSVYSQAMGRWKKRKNHLLSLPLFCFYFSHHVLFDISKTWRSIICSRSCQGHNSINIPKLKT